MYWLISLLKNQQIENLKSKSEAAEERVKVRDDRVAGLKAKVAELERLNGDLTQTAATLQRQIDEHASAAQLAATAKSISAIADNVTTANSAVSEAVTDTFAGGWPAKIVRSRLRPSLSFRCRNCGAGFDRWMGRCASCGTWNTIDEVK